MASTLRKSKLRVDGGELRMNNNDLRIPFHYATTIATCGREIFVDLAVLVEYVIKHTVDTKDYMLPLVGMVTNGLSEPP